MPSRLDRSVSTRSDPDVTVFAWLGGYRGAGPHVCVGSLDLHLAIECAGQCSSGSEADREMSTARDAELLAPV